MLKDYLWEIFGLADANDKPVDIGIDLLAHNLEHPDGPVFYAGADGLDYATLREQWAMLTEEEKAAAKNEAWEIIRTRDEALCAAFAARDREAFRALLAE